MQGWIMELRDCGVHSGVTVEREIWMAAPVQRSGMSLMARASKLGGNSDTIIYTFGLTLSSREASTSIRSLLQLLKDA